MRNGCETGPLHLRKNTLKHPKKKMRTDPVVMIRGRKFEVVEIASPPLCAVSDYHGRSRTGWQHPNL